ncbi:MAG: hypothetical protein ACRDST_12330 [Pseudonocardiaceae bacterium]
MASVTRHLGCVTAEGEGAFGRGRGCLSLRLRFSHPTAPHWPRWQRKRWLHLRADWPWTQDVINTWHAVTALPAPT